MTHLHTKDKKQWMWFCRIVVCCLALFFSGQTLSSQVALVLSKESKSYLRFVHSVEDALSSNSAAEVNISVTLLDKYNLSSLPGDNKKLPDLIVPVGSRSCNIVAKSKPDIPVLCTLVSKRSFENILKKGNLRQWSKLSAQYINQPLSRLFALIRAALPEKKAVGIIRSDEASYRLKTLRKEAKQANIKLRSSKFTNSDELVSVLNGVLKNNQVLLGLADRKVLNSNTVQSLLLTSYLQGVPVVAYSLPYVRAGALMTVHSTPEQLGEQLAEALLRLHQINSWSLNKPVTPTDFSVEVNERVAESLGLNLSSESKLKDRMIELLGAPQ